MKVFIAVDREGISGWFVGHIEDRQLERELMTADANAAVEGAFEGGATEVLVVDSHGDSRNLLPDKIDPRASFLSGQPRPLYLMTGIDSSFDAVMLVGYHAKAGTRNAVSCHTNSLFTFSLRVNGVVFGTIAVDAAIAGHYGVPVVLVTGDQATCDEAKDALGDIETVAVKEGVGMYAAKCKPLKEARRLIREGAKKALSRRCKITPLAVKGPVEVELTFITPGYADAVCSSPLIERVDGRTIRFRADDYLQAWNMYDIVRRAANSYF